MSFMIDYGLLVINCFIKRYMVLVYWEERNGKDWSQRFIPEEIKE